LRNLECWCGKGDSKCAGEWALSKAFMAAMNGNTCMYKGHRFMFLAKWKLYSFKE
jgi:hypothetical protein